MSEFTTLQLVCHDNHREFYVSMEQIHMLDALSSVTSHGQWA
jgi:hypothetical protein